MNRILSFAMMISICFAAVGCSPKSTQQSADDSAAAAKALAQVQKLEADRLAKLKAESGANGDAAAGANGDAQKPAESPFAGYTLISPIRSTTAYLLDMDKQVVHTWQSEYPPGNSLYLMDNGDLIRTARDPAFNSFAGGGIGGIVQKFDWDGNLLWQYRYANADHCAHHDVAVMPNGNILMIAWERKSKDDAIAAGRDPKLLSGNALWPDHVVEVKPSGTDGGEIVWEWHMWDHLVQDFSKDLPNYGVVYEHPELIDMNNVGSTPPATAEELQKLRNVGYLGGGDAPGSRRGASDWIHTNAINYNPELDQIVLSAKNLSELWVIDHSTTTQEAASHKGGKYGKGGDLLYRWGNPWNYKSGTIEDKMLFDQHDVRWIPVGLPGAGHITAFNNRPGQNFSTVVEIETPITKKGDYELNDDGRYGPSKLTWEYRAPVKEEFYSSFISGATRLANGNTLICAGAPGRIFEVNSEGTIVWDFKQPFGGELDSNGRKTNLEQVVRAAVNGTGGQRQIVDNNSLFRATRYGKGHPAFAGKDLKPIEPQPVPFSTLVELEVEKAKAAKAPEEKPSTESGQPAPAAAAS